MTDAPYDLGQKVAWLRTEAEGVRIVPTTVIRVEESEAGWRVRTNVGQALVDARGVGRQLVPWDESVARQVSRDGDLVRATTYDIERDRGWER